MSRNVASRKQNPRLASVFLILVFGFAGVWGQTWDGSTGPDWTDGANWVGGVAPSSNNGTENIDIPNGCPNYPVLPASDWIINDLTIGLLASITIGTNNLTINGVLSNDGIMIIDDAGRPNKTDINSGLVRYTAAAGGVITDFGANDYFDLEITGLGAFTVDNAALVVVNEFGIYATSFDQNSRAVSATNLIVGGGVAISFTNNAPLTVGTLAVDVGAVNDIALDDAGNDFTGEVRIVSGNDVTLVDTNTFVFGNGGVSAASGSLSVTARGAVSQAAPVTCAALTVKTTLNGGAAITLLDALNDADTVDLRTRNTLDNNEAAGMIAYVDADGFDVAQLRTQSTAGLSATAGGITDSGTIICTTLTTSSTAGTALDFGHTVTGFTAANTVSNPVSLVNTGALSVTVAGISQFDGGTVTILNTGAITLAGAVGTGDGTINLDTLGAGTITGAGVLSANTINLQTTAGSTGRVGTSAALPVFTSGTTVMGLGQGLAFTGAYVSHTGDLTLDVATLAANSPLRVIASGTLTPPATPVSTGTAELYLNSGADMTTTGELTTGTGLLTLVATGNLVVNADVSAGAAALISAGGTIGDGAVTITVAGTLTADAGSGITLDSAFDDFTGIDMSLSGVGDIVVVDVNGIDIIDADVPGGNLSVTAGGAITDALGSSMVVSGLATFDAGVNAITLGDGAATADFGSLALVGGTVTVIEDSAMTLDSVNVASIILVASGAITDSGAVVVSGDTSLNAGANVITLNTATNDFGGELRIVSAGDVTLVDTNALTFGNGGPSAITGSLALTTGGLVSQSQALIVGTTTSIAAGASDITLNAVGNDFVGEVRIVSGNDVTLVDTNTFVFGNGGTSAASGSLSVTARGAVAQNSPVTCATLTVKTTLNGGAAITLLDALNDADTVDLRSRNTADGADASGVIAYADVNSFDVVQLRTLSTASLTSTAGGITDSGSIVCTTLTTSSTAGTALDFGHTLTGFTAANTVSNPVSLVNTGALSITAAGISQFSGGTVTILNTGAITLAGAVGTGAGTINLDTLGAGTITGPGVLSANTISLQTTAGSTGRVGTSAALPVFTSGTTALAIGPGAAIDYIYLSHTGNLTIVSDITSSSATNGISLTLTGVGAVFTHSGGSLATSNAQALTIISDNFNLSGGTLSAGAGTMTLRPITNVRDISLGGGLAGLGLSNAELDTLRGSGIIAIGDANTAVISTDGAVVFNAMLTANIILTNGAAAMTLNNSVTTNANLSLISGGAVSGIGALTIGVLGANTLAVTAVGGITFSNVGNLAAIVSLSNASGGDIAYSNNRAFTLNAGNTFAGGLVGITNSTGLLTLAAVGVSSNNGNITLSSDDMNLLPGSVTAGSGAVSLYPSTTTLGISIGAGGSGLGLSDAEIDRITTTGSLSFGRPIHTGDITIDGITTITTASGAVSMLTEGGIIAIGANLAVSGNLNLNARANGVAVTGGVSGAGILTAGPAGVNPLVVTAGDGVNLSGNNLSSDVTITNSSAGNIVYVNNRVVSVMAANSAVNGTVSLTNNTGTTLVAAPGITTNGAGAANITIASAGAITQSGLITASGTGFVRIGASAGGMTQSAVITAPGGLVVSGAGAFTLTQANFVGTLAANLAGNLSLGSTGSISVGMVDLSTGVAIGANALSLTAGGAGTITQSQAITCGTLTLSAGGLIDLQHALNTIGTLGAVSRGGAFTLNDSDGGLLVTGPVTAGTITNAVVITTQGALLTVGGSISTSGAFNIALSATGITQIIGSIIDSGSGTISLDANDGAINLAGSLTTSNAGLASIVLRNATSAALGNTSASAGRVVLGLVAPNDLASAIMQTAGTTLSANELEIVSAGAITLTNAGNSIGTLLSVSRGGAFQLIDSAGGLLVTGPVTAGATTNAVTITTQGAMLTVNGDVSTSGAFNVALSGTGITQGAGSTVDGGDGTISLDANDGAYLLSGAMTTANITASAISLIDSAAAQVGNLSATSGGIVLGQAAGDNLSGNLTQAGGTTIACATLSIVAGGNVTLTAAANAFGTVSSVTAIDVSLNDSNGYSVTTIASSGNVLLQSQGGDITISGVVGSTGGAVTLNPSGTIVLSGGVSTGGFNINLQRPLNLTANVTLTTGAGLGDIVFSGAVTRDLVARTLGLTAGLGSVAFASTVGAAGLPLGAITINSALNVAGDVLVAGDPGTIHAASFSQLAGTGTARLGSLVLSGAMSLSTTAAVDLNGAITAPAGFSSSGTTFDNSGATITTTGTPIVINHTGNVIIGAALDSGAGIVNIDATGVAATIALNQPISVSTGAVTIDSVGTTTIAATGTISASGAAPVSFGATLLGTVDTAGNVSTIGGTVRYYNAVQLVGDIAITTGALAGDIVFSAALTRDGVARTLDLTAGTGSVAFASTLGTAGAPLGALTINTALNVAGTVAAGADPGTVHAASFTQLAGSGTTRLGSLVLGGSMSLTTTAAVDLNGAISAPGGFSSTGTSLDNTSATITTTDNPIVINHTGNILIGAALSSGAGIVNIDATGAATVTLNAAITVSTGAVTIDSGGTTTIAATGTITASAAAPVSFGSALLGTVNTASNVTTAGGTVQFNRAVALNGNISVSTGVALAGDILFTGAVSNTAAQTLNLAAGTGSISFASTIGSGIALGAITISSALNTEFVSTVVAASLIQSAGTGMTTLRNNISTSAVSGISIKTANITLDGLTVQANGTGIINFDAPVTLSTAAVILNAGGAVSFGSTIDGAQPLNITCATGNATVSSAIGNANALTSLAITATAGNVILNSIGNGAVNGVTTTVSVTATTGAISLFADHYKSGGAQTWTASTDGVRYLGTADGTWSAGGVEISLPATDLYLDHAGFTLTLGQNLSCRNLYFYRGNFSVAGRVLTTTANFVVFGGAYSADDGDWAGADTRHAYYHAAPLAYYPGAALHNGHTVVFDVAALPNAAFTAGGLLGAVVSIAGSFYNNGANMDTGAFTLNIPGTSGDNQQFNNTAAVIAGQWGSPYAAAFNMTVANATTNGGWVSAASQVFASAESNQMVVNGGGNNVLGTGRWQFSRPEISWAATIYDDVIRVEFLDQFGAAIPIENDANEINIRVNQAVANLGLGSVWYHGGLIKFNATWTNPLCTITTNGAGDLSAFYIRTVAGNWNTDARLLSAGNAISTDRDGTIQNRTVDLSFLKGLFRAASGKTMVRNYGINGFSAYSGTLDRCRPVLVRVEVGQAAHLVAPYNPWDGHNYFQLKWSEPVNIGNAAGFTIADATASNVKSQVDFLAIGEYGGYTSGVGTVTVAGYFSSPGTVDIRTRDVGDAAATEVNGLYRAGPNVYGTLGLYISLAGFSFPADGTLFWPGYIQTAVQPNLGITSINNTNITDIVGNTFEPTNDTATPVISGTTPAQNYGNNYAKAAIAVTANANDPSVSSVTPTGWDIVPTTIVDNGSDYDVVPFVTTGGEIRIERFEIQFTETIRDSSLSYPSNTTDILDTVTPAFEFRALGSLLPYRYGGALLTTNVQSPYLSGPINIKDDELVSILNTLLTAEWTTTSQMFFTYDREIGFVTDWAGNPLQDYTSGPPEKLCIEKIPPRLRLSTAIEDDPSPRIYVVFTEPIMKGPFLTRTTALVPGDFVLNGVASMGGIASVTPASLNADGWVLDAYLNLSGTVSLTDMLNARLALVEGVGNIIDRKDNQADPTSRRAVDIGMGVANVLAASDGIHSEIVGTDTTLSSGALGLLKSFDGTGRLYDKDITLFTTMDYTPAGDIATLAALPVQMYFDAEAPTNTYEVFDIQGRSSSLNLWLPTYLPGYNDAANAEARSLAPFFVGTLPSVARNFLIPASDADMVSGKEIGFLFRLGSLYLAREGVAGDPRSFDLWRIGVQDVIKQRGGVTILNNVIDSVKKERTAVQVDLVEGGQVTILVFTLDGDVVKALHRGRLGAGSYTFTWNGTNASGNPVARGMYFIRVVGSGIDEIRKVMVIKN